MHRPRFGSVFAAVAIAAAAVVPLFAAPAGAANTCDAGQFPASFAAQSGLKVDCHTDAFPANALIGCRRSRVWMMPAANLIVALPAVVALFGEAGASETLCEVP